MSLPVMFFAASASHAETVDLQGIGGRYAVPVTSLKQLRYRATMRQQYDFSCGSAAISTLLTHQYGDAVSEQTVFEGMYATGDQQKIRRDGFSLLDMKRYLASRGYEADGFVQPLDKLTEAGLPAVVLIAEKGYHHFVVIKGVTDGRVLVGDPANGTRSLPHAAFEKIWGSKLLFVIHGAAQAPTSSSANWRS